jgi:hypothetical protein
MIFYKLNANFGGSQDITGLKGQAQGLEPRAFKLWVNWI